VPGDWLDDLLKDWRVFDIGAFQLRLDALRQQRAEVEGQELHVLHVEGRGPSPPPLLLTHGS
jgi:Epoxide hydrolase N terminus